MSAPGPKQRRNKYQVVVLLDPDQLAAVDELATVRRQSRSSVLRLAVVEYLASSERACAQDEDSRTPAA